MTKDEVISVLRAQGTAKKAAPADTVKLVNRFRTWADALQPKIDNLGRPLTQNPTPKRNREYQSRLHDCRNMERLQKALRALADAHENGTIPESLSTLKTKDEIGGMVRKSITGGGGYYSVIEADDYSDTTPAARTLQGMIEGNPEERAERDRLRKIGMLEAEIKLSTIPGFFPTPSAVVDLMLDRANIEDGMLVLEPSAGSGNIVDAIRNRFPEAQINCIEPNVRLREILTLKGHNLHGDDFMEYLTLGKYDRVIMNPPFENQQDLDHIRRAYSLLREGGFLVSVMSPSFEFHTNSKSTEFRAWLETVNATWENLPDGSFKSSGTSVSTRLLVIEK